MTPCFAGPFRCWRLGVEVDARGVSFVLGDRFAVEVAEDVLAVVAPARGDAGDQHGGEGIGGAVVVLSAGAGPSVPGGEGRIDLVGWSAAMDRVAYHDDRRGLVPDLFREW